MDQKDGCNLDMDLPRWEPWAPLRGKPRQTHWQSCNPHSGKRTERPAMCEYERCVRTENCKTRAHRTNRSECSALPRQCRLPCLICQRARGIWRKGPAAQEFAMPNPHRQTPPRASLAHSGSSLKVAPVLPASAGLNMKTHQYKFNPTGRQNRGQPANSPF